MKFLLIEDNPDHRELISECCHDAFDQNCDITSFDTLVAGLSALHSTIYDIALIDLNLPDSNIEATTRALKDIQTVVPIIVLTSLQDEEVGRQLIKNGAQDFLPKDSLHKTLLQRMTHYAIERKHHQVQLEKRTTNQQVFCRSLSHDFKTPIRNIGQLTSLLKKQLIERKNLEIEDHKLFGKIDSRLQMMNNLVDGLYDYILIEQTQATEELVDLNHIVLELSQLLTADANSNISIHYDKLPILNGNRTQIFILFQNLLENAIKYCQTNPVIIITAEAMHKNMTSSGSLLHNIKICDNGIGIDKAHISKIFEPFIRLHSESEYQGSGLGLSVVQRIMENHHAQISLTSKLGEGTCFSLTFP